VPDIRISRFFFELQHPDHLYNEQEIAALIANSLTPKDAPTDFLLLASPGDGLTTVASDLERHLREMSLTDFHFARIKTDETFPAIFPPGIRSLLGKMLKSPFVRLRANWDSLRTKEKLSYGLVYLAALLSVNIVVPLWGSMWGPKETPLQIGSLFDIRSLAAISGVTILGTIIPAALVAYWKSFWKSLSDEDINAQVDELVSLARRNDFRCLVRLFDRRFIKGYGPLVLLIDSVDDLGTPMDRSFFYDHLIPRLRSKHRMVIVGLSSVPAEERILFKNSSPKVRAFNLSTLDLRDLSMLSGQQILHRCTVKEALGISVNNEERLRSISKRAAKLVADYDLATWNIRTLLCLLASASHLERWGFTKRSLEESLKNNASLLSTIASESPLGQLTTPEALNLLRVLFETSAVSDWFIFNEAEKIYLWDSLGRRAILRESSTQLKILGCALWLSSLLREHDQHPSPSKIFEMGQLAKELRDLLLNAPEITLNLQAIGLLSSEILRSFRRRECAELHRSCGTLYFLVNARAQHNPAILPDDVMALESIVSYGLMKQPELSRFIENLRSSAQIPLILKLAHGVTATDRLAFDRSFEDLRRLLPSAEAEIKVSLRWMFVEGYRQHFVLPLLLLSERRDYWEEYLLGMPSISGGFNLATLSALQMLSDAGDLNQKENFLAIWESIADGVLSVNQLQPTSWEVFWVEYVALALITEILAFSEPVGGHYIYDHEGFRHDMSLDFLSDHHFKLLTGLANILGLRLPAKRPSIISVASLKAIVEGLEGMRLKCLLWSLRKLADSLVLYRAKFLINAVNFHDLPKENREGLLMDLQRLAAGEAALNRRSLSVEAMLVLYRLHFQLHRSLSSDTILDLIGHLHKLGCPGELVDALYERYIQELRFSHDTEKMRLAIHLLLRRVRIESDSYSHLKRSKMYCILSSEFSRLHKKRAANLCLARAKSNFDRAEDPIKNADSLSQLRDVELHLFIEKVRIQSEDEDEDEGNVEGKIMRFLANAEYRSAPGNAFFLLLPLAADRLSPKSFGHLVEAIRSADRTDWYAGYIWSLLLERVDRRIRETGILSCEPTLVEATRLIIGFLERSDKNGMDLDSTIEVLRATTDNFRRVGDDWYAAKANVLCDDLFSKQLAIRYSEAITLWTDGGTLGEIAFSYYRLLAPYSEDRVPGDFRKWMRQDDYLVFKEEGVEKLNHLLKEGRNVSWLALFLAVQLERRALRAADNELRRYLQGVWLRLGISCLESLVETSITSTSLPNSIKSLLRQQSIGFAKLFARDRAELPEQSC